MGHGVFGDLQLEAEMGRGSQSVVYRASRGGAVFALKVLREDVARSGHVSRTRFRREAALLACLRHRSLPAILEVGDVEGRPYLLLELVLGPSLAAWFAQGRPTEASLISIARDLAGALSEVHRHGLVHRDVKPQNVVVSDTGRATLIDFGFVARATGGEAGRKLAGTLQYSAPEQSGMLKRPVDGRADLYALGAILFEGAAGRPPFTATDVGELLRQHAAHRPPDLRPLRPDLSPALVAVIEKLLAKDPDDRYQSGEALAADLDRLTERAGAEAPGGLVPAKAELRTTPVAEPAFVGREAERASLSRLWSRALERRGGVALLHGESGSGKSRLMRETARQARSAGALVLEGKCLRADPLPFAPLREAIDEHLRQLRRLPDAEREAAEQRIRQAAGDAAGLLKRLSPGLSLLFRDASEDPGLAEAQDLFYGAVARFLVRLAELHPGAAFLLDDVQWADPATLQVMRWLSTLLAQAPLVLLCTSRDEPECAEGARAFTDAIGGTGEVVLRLGPLGPSEVEALISSELGGRAVSAELADAVLPRSNGLPLAVVEYVRAMLDSGLLVPHWGEWKLDTEALDRLQLPQDVIQLVVRRISSLGDEARRVLTAAAMIGMRFSTALLGPSCGLGEDEVLAALSEAVTARLADFKDTGTCAFVHNRVREALLGGLSVDEARALHRRIATALDAQEGQDASKTYALARHYDLGEAPEHARRRYETNLAAGQLALEERANEEAHLFLEAAQRAASELGLPRDAELATARGDACARSGRLAESVEQYTLALSVERIPARRAELRCRLAHVHLGGFDTQQAWSDIASGMAELGIRHPRSLISGVWVLLWAWLVGWVTSLFGPRLRQARGEEAERHRLFAKLCDLGAHVAYFDVRNLLLLQMTYRPWASALRLGPGRELVFFLGNNAIVQAVLGRPAATAKESAKAASVAEQLNDRALIARSLLYQGIATHIAGDSSGAEAQHRRWVDAYGRFLDAGDFVNGCVDAAWAMLARGYVLEAEAWIRQAHARAAPASAGADAALLGHPYPSFLGAILAILGRPTEGLAELQRVRLMVEKAPGERWRWSVYLQNLVLFHLEQGELGPALEEALARHARLGMRPEFAPFHLRLFFVYAAHARLAKLKAGSARNREELLGKARAAVAELQRAATTPVLQAHACFCKGVLRRLEGKAADSAKLLAKAEVLAREVDCPWILFEVMVERAQHFRERGQMESSRREARLALTLADGAGWEARARRVRAHFQVESSSRSTSGSSEPAEEAPAHALRLQRQLDALLEVSLACANVFEPREQARVALDVIVRIFGAERAFLLLCREGTQELALSVGRGAGGVDLEELGGYSRTVIERVRDTHRPLVVTGTDEGEVRATESILANDLRSIMAAPLLLHGRLLGVVYLDHRLARGVFGREDEVIFVAIANHISVALETARAARLQLERVSLERDLAAMHQQANTDALTGLKNRRALEAHLQTASARARRSGLPLTVMMMDIDHFKSVNDKHGHQTGDVVLASVAKAVASCTRATDFVARYGGEEFCVVIEDTGHTGAQAIAEHIRQTVAALAFQSEAGEFKVTSSAGLGELGVHGDTVEDALRAADEALYTAKRGGRNQVRVAPARAA
ncbi:diguanylate cyclase domain-containing protein [Corallococcus aberystwythensis]|uniref:diguanylate cyclase n=1 Tax=Corallococcus aberystwythensis TaxID=2316722 RepID=A0A3A8PSW5_9BACT|nr:diguanylate cyclase [Corallococcus aberystwythensis]RKH59556.1 diguanylate cyclase [Corallococcus aberystwythensis]